MLIGLRAILWLLSIAPMLVAGTECTNLTFRQAPAPQPAAPMPSSCAEDCRGQCDQTVQCNDSCLRPCQLDAYRLRRTIRIEAGDSPAPAGLTIAVQVDHAAWVNQGQALAGGDDLRVFYFGPSGARELDRRLTSGSAWNLPNTLVELRLVEAIEAGAFSDGEYFLYYGRPDAGQAPALNAYIEWIAETFSEPGRRDWITWDLTDDHTAPDWHVADGTLRYQGGSAATKGPPYLVSKLVHAKASQATAWDLRLSLSLGAPGGLLGVGLCSNDPSAAGDYTVISSGQIWLTNEASVPASIGYWLRGPQTGKTHYSAPIGGTQPLLWRVVWKGKSLDTWLNDQPVASWSLRSAIAGENVCLVTNSRAPISVDDFTARILSDLPVTVSVGPEQVPPAPK